jgi:hypothetical protein
MIEYLCQDFPFLLRANDRAKQVDSFFVCCAAVPSQGRHGFQNLLSFQSFGSSIPRLDRVGG